MAILLTPTLVTGHHFGDPINDFIPRTESRARRGYDVARISLRFPRWLTIALVAIPFASNASTEIRPATREAEASVVSIESFPPKWLGTYEPTGSARGPKVNSLIISKRAFTWGGCVNTTIRQIVRSENEFVFEVNPNAECSWAGWIMRLNVLVPHVHITADAYRTKHDFESRRYSARYSFSKVE
jgi:hypothetical protein